ncbi:MAG TPA: aminoglycoside phosphotransferase family protein [Gemmataceae bacterium]|nr:aminoglycoside phosphotransferase family protein [Gemmataceae bacterium]
MTADTTLGPERTERARRLLESAGCRGPFTLARLAGGANNQVYRVNDGPLVLKAYATHPADPRDRLGAEFALSTFAWGHGLRCLPQPVACDRDARLALYGHVAGRSLAAEEVTAAAVRQAVDFFARLNELKGEAGAADLPDASEACFSLDAHLQTVGRRVERLRHIEEGGEVESEAARFVADELAPACAELVESLRRRAERLGIDAAAVLPFDERCLSPSDFGFHNALLAQDGRLVFVDFEYAGWDDPAKAACDFFCQPRLPVPAACWDDFAAAVVRGLSEPERHLERMRLLLPAYRLKWCCILLNDFLPAGRHRRRFALAEADETEAKHRQLRKAREALRVAAAALGRGLAA